MDNCFVPKVTKIIYPKLYYGLSVNCTPKKLDFYNVKYTPQKKCDTPRLKYFNKASHVYSPKLS